MNDLAGNLAAQVGDEKSVVDGKPVCDGWRIWRLRRAMGSWWTQRSRWMDGTVAIIQKYSCRFAFLR